MGYMKDTVQSEATQDDLDDRLAQDLHTLEVSAGLLRDCPLLDRSLRSLIGELYRSLKGCRHCSRILGDLHTGSCTTGGGRVLSIDLGSDEQPNIEPDVAVAPF